MFIHKQIEEERTKNNTPYGETLLETPSEQFMMACSLVLSSVGISHRVSGTTGRLFLQVNAEDLHAARYEIETYQAENANWPPKPDNSLKSYEPLLQPPTLLLIGALALFYTVTGPWSGDSSWFSSGAGDAGKILQNHEYYRLVTALTLHADTSHLLGNCFFGGFLFHFFCRLTGNGLGLFAMVVTAALGNYLNVFVHGQNHLFVGFSTAVFAVIGMLAMLGKEQKLTNRYIRVIPFMAGAALLAMIGSSGERTDLGGHLFGLLCGFGSGWLLGRPLLLRLREVMWLQGVLFTLSCVIIYLCWQFALL